MRRHMKLMVAPFVNYRFGVVITYIVWLEHSNQSKSIPVADLMSHPFHDKLSDPSCWDKVHIVSDDHFYHIWPFETF